MKTIGELAYWIQLHRRGKAFVGYTLEQIASEIINCLNKNTLVCVVDDGQIVGVICWHEDCSSKCIQVHNILTIKQGVLKRMLNEFHRRYEGYKIEGKRKGVDKTFINVQSITDRL